MRTGYLSTNFRASWLAVEALASPIRWIHGRSTQKRRRKHSQRRQRKCGERAQRVRCPRCL